MPVKFLCLGCGGEEEMNPRLKGNQKYCGEAKSQKARKAKWQQERMKTNREYKNSQEGCVQRWRKEKPLHQYQHEYRSDHPDYVKINRQQQKQRNRKRRERDKMARSKKIVPQGSLWDKNGHVCAKLHRIKYLSPNAVGHGFQGKDCPKGITS